MKKDKKWFVDKWTKERNKTDVHDPMYHFINEFIADVDQLDEPGVLSQEWIDKYAQGDYDEWVYTEDLQNLLVPKQEKVKVDKEDAKNIKDYKEEGWRLSHLINDTGADANHEELLAQAWLAYPNIEVEKEQKYFAKIKGHENISSDDKYWNYCITDESLDIGDNKVHADVLAEYILNATKDEWKNLGINEDNADFVKVEELEE